MTERIKKLTELTLSGQMYADTVKTTYDEADLLLPRQQMESKRICEYILNQEPKLTEYSCLTGFFNFDGSVVGDAFRRGGHKATQKAFKLFYLRQHLGELKSCSFQTPSGVMISILPKKLMMMSLSL